MTPRIGFVRGVTASLLVAAGLVCAAAQSSPHDIEGPRYTPAEKAAFLAFSQQARDYAKATQSLPDAKMKPTADIAKLEDQRKTFRSEVQQSRANAKQGDLFTPDAAPMFRKLLAQTMAGPDGGKIRASLQHAEPNAPTLLRVNDVYPNLKGAPLQSTPATLLMNLPPLPKGLEYRVAGKTLALRDADANLVVDFLPNALP